MNDTRLRRRLAAAAMAAASVLASPALPGCASPGTAPAAAGGTAAALPGAAAAGGHATKPGDLKFEEQAFQFPRAERVVLSNGMVLHLIQDHSLPLVDASAIFRGGSAFDPPGKEGLAAISCGMVRTGGTKTLDPAKLDAELDLIAGSVGVGADQEDLTAGFSFLSKDLDRGLELFADVIRNPAFDAQRFAQVKMGNAQGLQRQLQSAPGVLGRAFSSLVHPGHPYGALPTPKSLGSLTREDLVEFHGKWFHPESFILSVAGDFDRDALVAKLEKVFAGWEKSPEPLPKWPAPYERKYEGGHFVVPMAKVEQTNIRMGHWGPPQNTVERVHFDVMNLILGGGGFWNRMVKIVRTKEGLAYSVGSGLTRASQGGVFQASVETKAATTYRAISLMKRVMEEVRDQPVTEEELSLARESVLNRFVQVIESPASLARLYAANEFNEYPEGWLDRFREIVRATTIEDVQRIAKEYLRPEAMTLVVVGDPSTFDEAPADLGPVQSIQPR